MTKLAEENGLEVHYDSKKMEVVRNMQQKCVIIDEEKHMRGLDFRLTVTNVQAVDPEQRYGYANAGIDLLISKQFNSSRSLKQGLGRVGRYREPCNRYTTINEECLFSRQYVKNLDRYFGK